MNRKYALGLLAGVLVGSLVISSTIAAEAESKAKVGEAAPLFALPDQDGKQVSLGDLSDKVVVLEWFNDECPIVQRCYKDEAMNKLAAKYKEKGVVWLAINSSAHHDVAHNKEAAKKMKMDRQVLADPSGAVGHAYGATNTPGMYVINKGKLAYMGAIDNNTSGNKTDGVKNYVSQAIDQVLAGETVSEPQTKQYGCTVKYAK